MDAYGLNSLRISTLWVKRAVHVVSFHVSNTGKGTTMRQTAWKARESCKYSRETLVCLSLLPEVSVYFSDEFVLAHESRGVGRWWLEKDHGNAFRIGFSYQIWEASRPGVSGSSKKNSWSAGAEKTTTRFLFEVPDQVSVADQTRLLKAAQKATKPFRDRYRELLFPVEPRQQCWVGNVFFLVAMKLLSHSANLHAVTCVVFTHFDGLGPANQDCHSTYWWLPPRGSYWWQQSISQSSSGWGHRSQWFHFNINMNHMLLICRVCVSTL